ncbi:MAG: ECF transporter S component [Clostridia bacterium]
MKTFLFGNAKGKTEIIVRIAIMMALTVLMQFVTGFAKIQLLTGSFVNLFLFLSVMLTGLVGGLCVGVVTPFIALAFGLNPNILLVPFIALANGIMTATFALVCKLLKVESREIGWQIAIVALAIVLGATLKFLFMYFVCVKLIFPLFMADKMLKAVSVAFGVTQLFTALIGGLVATMLVYPLKRAKLLFSPAQPQEQNL